MHIIKIIAFKIMEETITISKIEYNKMKNDIKTLKKKLAS
jgi:hypothetical protein